MAYLAIARKWRPTQFDDLVGQGHVVQTLKNAIALNRVSHAYLFCGARGIGKTSVARIFAKTLRCPNAKDAAPCNVCPECLAISESRSVDVVEIDGASNNGVEAVRAIRENVVYGAASGHYKIYIIDEVHMLSISAFNALLKTLEEPPPHVLFIFATTESQKIPLTIVSRCQRFEFRRLTNVQIVGRLQQILESEGVKLSEDGLRTIAVHSDGSLRDALSLLDQVLSFYGEKDASAQTAPLTEKQVTDALGVNESSTLRGYWSFVVKQDIKGLIQLIGEAHLAGLDLKHFAECSLEELRLLYLLAVARETKEEVTPDELDISLNHLNELRELASQAPLVRVERMAQILAKAIQQLGWSSSPRFVLEMASIRMAKLDDLEKVAEGKVVREPVATPAPAPIKAAPVKPVAAPVRAVPAPQPPPPMQQQPAPIPPPEYQEQPPTHAASFEAPAPSWKGFVETAMKKRPLLGALLSHASFQMISNGEGRTIRLAFPDGSFYERQAKETKNRLETEELLKIYFGKDTTLDLASPLENGSASLEETRRLEHASLKKSALEHPAVLQMQEMLGAEVIDVNVDN